LVTARGGSKGIPHKNLAPLNGKPLLQYTAESALRSKRLTRVVLSTDDAEISRVGRDCGLEVPFERPEELASDRATSIDVALHALTWLQSNDQWVPEVVVILQPTSPFRTAAHIDHCVNLMSEQPHVQTVVSVVAVPHRYNPHSLMKMDGQRLVDYLTPHPKMDRYRRQELPQVLARNGPVVLASRTDVIQKNRTFYGDPTLPYLMDDIDSLDIDSPNDLLIAELLMQHRDRSAVSHASDNKN
ncbi:MAG: acylneuraminate cytidylyltransferase family protein, partial [Pirellulales bacterium]|nr:acylneuraminate cytidylyltransferase family protein [Pirellulales bacterium]